MSDENGTVELNTPTVETEVASEMVVETPEIVVAPEVAPTPVVAAPVVVAVAPVVVAVAPVVVAVAPVAAPELEQMPALDDIIVPGSAQDGGDSGNEMQAGDLLIGEVVLITKEGVLVDIGTKSEGLIRPNELSKEPVSDFSEVVRIGERIEVVVLDPDGRDGIVMLSKKRADFEKSWTRIHEALKTGEVLQGLVIEKVRGGLVVDLGVRGFVPASHVSNGKLKDLSRFVGQTLPLKVLEVERDRKQSKVVLSHLKATEDERAKQKEDTLAGLKENATVKGIVRRVTDYGAFVDLGGVDGLLHVSQMSWTRVKQPSDVVKKDQEVEVVILKIDKESDRISLGMRQILPDPWTTVAADYTVGQTVDGEVTRIVPFGAFIQLGTGIEGIIPLSELAHRRVNRASDVVDTGDKIQVRVLDIRPEERRMTLSLRALQNPDTEAEFRPNRTATEGDGTRKKDKRPRREDEGSSGGGGGDYRNYMRTGSVGGNEFGTTLGDMFGDMFAASSRPAKKNEKRRRQEDEDEDLSDITGDEALLLDDPIEEAETEVVAETATE
jgi:predicted RNA-binding protein with RPS1 domain